MKIHGKTEEQRERERYIEYLKHQACQSIDQNHKRNRAEKKKKQWLKNQPKNQQNTE